MKNDKSEPFETPYSLAWKRFVDTEPDSFNASTLGVSEANAVYLSNRLKNAFAGGWRAACNTAVSMAKSNTALANLKGTQ